MKTRIKTKLYNNKERDYFQNLRLDLCRYVPRKADNNILEIGAGEAHTLIHLKKNGQAGKVTGIDIVRTPGSNQSNPLIDRFIIGNIETMKLSFPAHSFDVILCGDILEHLIDPWAAVKKLSLYLKKNGLMISSIPNIRKLKIFGAVMLSGDFKYVDSGLLDRTHLRFFCKKNMVDLFNDKGLHVIRTIPDLFPVNHSNIWKNVLNIITFRVFEEFLARRYIIVARK